MEMDAGHFPRDARADLDRAARRETADIIVPLADLTDQRRGDRDRGGGRCGGDRVGMVEQLDADDPGDCDRHEDQPALLPPRPARPRSLGGVLRGIDRGLHVHTETLRLVWPTRIPVTLVTSVSICASEKPFSWKLLISVTGSAKPRWRA